MDYAFFIWLIVYIRFCLKAADVMTLVVGTVGIIALMVITGKLIETPDAIINHRRYQLKHNFRVICLALLILLSTVVAVKHPSSYNYLSSYNPSIGTERTFTFF